MDGAAASYASKKSLMAESAGLSPTLRALCRQDVGIQLPDGHVACHVPANHWVDGEGGGVSISI
jgi:hypothetical protein